MASILQYLYATLAFLVSAIALPTTLIISMQWARTCQAPRNLPWVGLKDRRFLPKLRATLAEITAGRAPLNEGYEKYGKHGKPFVLPGLHGPEVAIPPAQLSWLASQPENVVSSVKAQDDILCLEYLGHGPNVVANYDFTVVRRDLTRQLSRILSHTFDELKVCFEEKIGSGADLEDWKEVEVNRAILTTSRRLNNRLFVGLPMCRDKRYIKGLARWEVGFGVGSALIRYLVPYSLKPLLAPLFSMPVNLLKWRLTRLLVPIVRQRLQSQEQNDADKETAERPNDVLQWIIDSSAQRKGEPPLSEYDIASKAVLLNFFAVHTTAITASAILTDLLCYFDANSIIEELRAEADEILPRLEAEPRAVRDMPKMDSVIRESLRFTAMMGRGLQREVVKPGGLETPDGVHLTQGTRVCVVVSSRQCDSDLWSEGDKFMPLRFYKDSDDLAMSGEEKPRSAVHVTEDFMSFGFGRHACPGRFFAVQTLKIMLGYLLAQYDFEPLSERPKRLEIGEAQVEKEETKIKMRLRKDRDVLKREDSGVEADGTEIAGSQA